MNSPDALLALLVGGYSTIAILGARTVLRERRGRRRGKAATGLHDDRRQDPSRPR